MHNCPIYGYFVAFNGTRQQKCLAIRTLRRFLHMFPGVTKFAESEHWEKSDFWIYYYENSEWDYVSFVFVSRQFDHEDERTSYLRVWRYLADYFRDDPELLEPVRLVVKGKAKVDRGGLDGIGSDYEEFWSFAPVPHSS